MLLGATTLPEPLVDQLVDGAPMSWLLGEPAEALAADLALCWPALGPGEVRASVKPTTDRSAWRLTVVANDRPGLLAATAGVLASHGMSLTSGSTASWPDLGLALQCVVAADPAGGERLPSEWDDLGKSLRASLGTGEAVVPNFRPMPPVRVSSTAQGHGRCLVTVEAPDRVGLLWAVARWCETNGCNIEATTFSSNGRNATSTLLVTGDVDSTALAAAVGGTSAISWRLPSVALKVTVNGALAAAGVAAALVVRGLRAGRRSH
jgi:predicted amino acid-binding ACT domain protein